MYSYLFTEAGLESFLFGMSAMAPNILCNCADRRFIDVCSYKGLPLVKQQYSLSQMDDCWIRKERGEALGREGKDCLWALQSVSDSLHLVLLYVCFFFCRSRRMFW